MCVPQDAAESVTRTGPNRRSFLRTAGLVGAGAAAVGPLGSLPAFAADPQQAQQPRNVGRWNPDPDSLQFTLAVMPDTQFLYWGSQHSINPAPQEESFRYVINHSGNGSGDNVVFMAHLGVANDAYVLGESLGIDRSALFTILSRGSANSFGLGIMSARTLPEMGALAGSLLRKDVDIVAAVAAERGADAGSLIDVANDAVARMELP